MERSPSRDELPLIEYDSLREGLFQQMVTALRESPFSDAIRRSVSFEVASWTERGLENAYVLCQAALEAVVGVLEKEVALLAESNNVPWKKIMKALTGSIEMVGEEEKLSDDVIKLIKSKLPELERPPIADQIIFHATRLAIEKNDLWPSSVGFEEGLRSALRQRNLLVHAAHIQDPSEAYRNLVRMRELAERFILAVLGVRQEEIG